MPRRVVRERAAANKAKYEPVAPELVPGDLKWKFPRGMPNSSMRVFLSTPGGYYKLVRDLNTGAVEYFKLKDQGPAPASREKIDAEPEKKGQVRYRVGARCWFVDTGNRWYLVEVVDRVGADRATFGEPCKIVIKPVGTFDADKQAPWPYTPELEFPAYPNNPMFMRLRPLKARYQ